MTGVIIILLVTIFVGFLLYVYDRKWQRSHPDASQSENHAERRWNDEESDSPSSGETESEVHGEICCGRHLVCEKSLSPMPGDKIEYFDDEELDRFAGRPGEAYTDEESDEFREIMETMREEELPAWVRSLQLRGIELPYQLRDTFFLLLGD